jgi:hypothetical protein
MESQQMMELLLAMQEDMKANRDERKADLEELKEMME